MTLILQPERLKLSRTPTKLIGAIDRREREALCPCEAVSEFLNSQLMAYGVLITKQASEELKCVALEYLWPEKRIELVEDPLNSATDALAFTRPELLEGEHPAIFEHDTVKAFQELTPVVCAFFPRYRVGPRLRVQVGSAPIRLKLNRAYRLLGALGLIDDDLVAPSFAHSSVLMLMRRALGAANYPALIPYIANPAGFLASLIADSTSVSEKERDDFINRFQTLLWGLSPPAPHIHLPPAQTEDFCLPRDQALSILASLYQDHSKVARDLGEIAWGAKKRVEGEDHLDVEEADGVLRNPEWEDWEEFKQKQAP